MLTHLSTELRCVFEAVSKPRDECIIERVGPSGRHLGRQPGIGYANSQLAMTGCRWPPKIMENPKCAVVSKNEADRRGTVWADLLCAPKEKEKEKQEGRKQSL